MLFIIGVMDYGLLTENGSIKIYDSVEFNKEFEPVP
jgi:ribosomal protein S24E